MVFLRASTNYLASRISLSRENFVFGTKSPKCKDNHFTIIEYKEIVYICTVERLEVENVLQICLNN